MKTRLVLSTCILLAFLMSMANAGLMIKEQDEGETVTQIYQDGMMVVLSDQLNNKAGMIIDMRKSQCTWFNHSSQKFARGNCSAPSEIIGNMAQNIQNRLSSEQLAMMQQIQDQETEMQLPPLQVKKIGHANFQSFAVDKYHFLAEGRPIAEVWMSPDLAKAIYKEAHMDMETMKKLFGDQENKGHSSVFAFQGPEEILEEKIDALSEKEKAYVIKVMMLDGSPDAEKFSSQVIEIKMGNFDLNQYRAPSNYEEVDFNELMQGALGQQ